MPQFLTHNDCNFGYGRGLSYAGHNALKVAMPDQFHTVATHSDRWKQFCLWAKCMGIKEAHEINNHTLRHYAEYLRARLNGEGQSLSVATAQNRLSTCNVVLRALRGNGDISIKPAEALQANRHKVRTEAPELSREKLAQVQADLIMKGFDRVAVILGLCRELGLRSKEAALLDCQKALQQYKERGSIDVELGTKGGRGKRTATSPSRAERWVPVTDTALLALTQAARLQGTANNLIPAGKWLPDFLAQVREISGSVLKQYGLKHRHDLRAAYACEQYQRLTGKPAPVIADDFADDKSRDLEARQKIAMLLGHNRLEVVSAYLGSRKRKGADSSSTRKH